MNLAAGLPLFCPWFQFQEDRPKPTGSTSTTILSMVPRGTAGRLALASLIALVVGALLGVLMGYVKYWQGDHRLVTLLPHFRRKMEWGGMELLCSVVWLTLYWGWHRFFPPRRSLVRWGIASLPVLSSTNLLYHFPSLMHVMAQGASGRVVIEQPVTAPLFRSLAYRSDVLAMACHFALASVAISGVAIMWYVRSLPKALQTHIPGERLGASASLLATIAQLPVGIWVTVSLSPDQQSDVLGEDLIATGFLVSGLVASYAFLQSLAAIVWAAPPPTGDNQESVYRLSMSTAWLLLTVCLMTALLIHLR